MALKLRRQLEVFTNTMLARRTSRCPPSSLATGAASFKRVLGSALLGQQYRLGVNAPPNQPDWRNDFRTLIGDRTEHAAGV